MRKYYELKLNCARADYENPTEIETGFMEVLPVVKETKYRVIFKEVVKWETEYKGKFYIIATKKDGHFEDIVLGKKIYFNPNGVRDIKHEPDEVLFENNDHDMSCYEYSEIDYDKVKDFLMLIHQDKGLLDEYKKEVDTIEKKEIVIDELKRRTIERYDSNQLIKDHDSGKTRRLVRQHY